MNKATSILIVLFFILPMLFVPVFADHGLDTQLVSEQEYDQVLESLKFDILHEVPETGSIACFDVNEEGFVAMGFYSSPKACVLVYDQTGSFVHGVCFDSPGSFGISFSGRHIYIYFTRSHLLCSIELDSLHISLEYVKHTKTNDAVIKDMMYGTSRCVEGVEYRLERDMGLSAQSYSRLVIASEGISQTFYDVTLPHNILTLAVYVGLAVFAVIVIRVAVISHCGKQKG